MPVVGFEIDETLTDSPAMVTPVMPPRFVPVTVTLVPVLPMVTERWVIVGTPRYCAAAEEGGEGAVCGVAGTCGGTTMSWTA